MPKNVVRLTFALCGVMLFFAISVKAADPVPEFYGVYALDGGRLLEITEENQLDLSPNVRFVVFLKGLGVLQPINKIYFIPPPPAEQPKSNKEFSWDDFYKKTQTPGGALDKSLEGLPANAIEIPFQIGPYGGSDEMEKIVPKKELEPGLYQLHRGVRFWVEKAAIARLYPTPGANTTSVDTNRAVATAAPKQFPVSSGTNVFTKVTYMNQTPTNLDLYLDDSESPIPLKKITGYEDSLEVGSRHILRTTVKGKQMQYPFTVEKFMRTILIDFNGIHSR